MQQCLHEEVQNWKAGQVSKNSAALCQNISSKSSTILLIESHWTIKLFNSPGFIDLISDLLGSWLTPSWSTKGSQTKVLALDFAKHLSQEKGLLLASSMWLSNSVSVKPEQFKLLLWWTHSLQDVHCIEAVVPVTVRANIWQINRTKNTRTGWKPVVFHSKYIYTVRAYD